MRLGTRWEFGAEPPASVPADLWPRIAAADHLQHAHSEHDGTRVSDAIVDVHDADEDW